MVDCRLVEVVCDKCGRVQANAQGSADDPHGCRGCGHKYGTYAVAPAGD